MVQKHGSDQILGVSLPNMDQLVDHVTIPTFTTKEELIPDIDKGDPKPGSDQSRKQIFFIETTNPDGGLLELNPREACSIESTASFHPNRDIYVIFTGPTTMRTTLHQNNKTRMDKVLTKNYKNVHFRSVNLEQISQGTALEVFVRLKKYQDSKHLPSHLSDILRYLILWKYSGLFLDLDIVVLKNFDKLTENYVCKSSNNFLMSGTMHFAGTGIGHTAAEKCLDYLREKFDGNRWAANGPEVVTAVMKDICNTNMTQEMTTQQCQGIKVFGSGLFLPITDNFMYFKEEELSIALRLTKHAYTAHIYNHASKRVKITRDSKCAYLELAKKFCPHVYDSFDTYF